MNNPYMDQALAIAYSRMGDTSPNPPVGAVIVKEGRVISTGGTSQWGGPHAEVNALAGAQNQCPGADIYVTLEPCSHYGRTPPCTEAIIAAGIKNVYIPLLDPNPSVAGRGVKGLLDAGINVEFIHEYRDRAASVIRAFKKNISRSLPFIIHKSAMTLDGKTASCTGDSKWISSPGARLLVHRLRSKFDAIMVGRGTVDADRPALTVRPQDFKGIVLADTAQRISGIENFILDSAIKNDFGPFSHPVKVVMGIPSDLEALEAMNRQGTLIVYASEDQYDPLPEEVKKRCGLFDLKIFDSRDDRSTAEKAAADLYSRGISTVLLEGGAGTSASFFEAGLIDQFIYTYSPKILGGGRPLINGKGFDTIGGSLIIRDLSVYRIDADILVTGYKDVYNFEML